MDDRRPWVGLGPPTTLGSLCPLLSGKSNGLRGKRIVDDRTALVQSGGYHIKGENAAVSLPPRPSKQNVRDRAAFSYVLDQFGFRIVEPVDPTITHMSKQPNLLTPKVEGRDDANCCPLSEQPRRVRPELIDNTVLGSVPHALKFCRLELGYISLSPQAVDDPYYVPMKRSSLPRFFQLEVRMLKLDDQPIRRLDIGDVKLT